MTKGWTSILALALLGAAPQASGQQPAWDSPQAGNPLLPGYFADPSLVHHEGRWYIYATFDPWGEDRLGVWESTDFANWTFRELNWPTKAAATSPTSQSNKVWAPSVVKGGDGRFWMYVSVGSEIWVGVADAPLGPWRNALGDRPLIPGDYRPSFHMIDAEAFIDDDGQAYLYWGSGLDWVNGHCFAVKLKPDMVSFDGEPVDVTPANYFEAPFMLKHDGRYYLTYSKGKTIDETYQVRYAVGASPLGPFTEAANSPILSTDHAKQIIGPGHHSIFQDHGQPYILYHRLALPFTPGSDDLQRQVAVDRLRLDAGGLAKVEPTHEGARPGPARVASGLPFTARVASGPGTIHGPERATDNNYATLWRAGAVSGETWIEADLGQARTIEGSMIRPEFPGRPYKLTVAVSQDRRNWRVVGPTASYQGSPIHIDHAVRARYVRLIVEPGAGLFEWSIEGR